MSRLGIEHTELWGQRHSLVTQDALAVCKHFLSNSFKK